MPVTAPALPEGSVLLRLPVRDRGWPQQLPPVPAGARVTVTVGRADLLPDPTVAAGRGYLVVGAASEARPIGDVVDLLVSPELQGSAHAWWTDLLERSHRAFDLRHGPVQRVLAAELAMHAQALAR